eukprot:scaffold10910_cov75-Phaeocystis_antarctica.AAC.1
MQQVRTSPPQSARGTPKTKSGSRCPLRTAHCALRACTRALSWVRPKVKGHHRASGGTITGKGHSWRACRWAIGPLRVVTPGCAYGQAEPAPRGGGAGATSGTAEDARRAFDHAAHASLDASGRQALLSLGMQRGARRARRAQRLWGVDSARLHAPPRVRVLFELFLLGASLPYLAAAAQAHASVLWCERGRVAVVRRDGQGMGME